MAALLCAISLRCVNKRLDGIKGAFPVSMGIPGTGHAGAPAGAAATSRTAGGACGTMRSTLHTPMAVRRMRGGRRTPRPRATETATRARGARSVLTAWRAGRSVPAREALPQGGAGRADPPRGSGTLHLGGRKRGSRYEPGMVLAGERHTDGGLVAPARQDDTTIGARRPPDISLDSPRAYALGYDPSPLAEELRGRGRIRARPDEERRWRAVGLRSIAIPAAAAAVTEVTRCGSRGRSS